MIWQLLGKAIDVGATLFAGGMQNKANEEASKKSYDMAMLNRLDQLSAQGEQQNLAYQQQNLAQQQFGFQKSEARKQRKMQQEQLKQQKVDRMLGMLGNSMSLKNNLLNMWSKTGIMGE